MGCLEGKGKEKGGQEVISLHLPKGSQFTLQSKPVFPLPIDSPLRFLKIGYIPLKFSPSGSSPSLSMERE
jgi:hypothetical protein